MCPPNTPARVGRLDQCTTDWDPRASLGVVMAAGGYPEAYAKGLPISGLPTGEEPDRKVFHAGTAERDGQIVTSGGRVLCVTALGADVAEAQRRAYEQVHQIRWQGAYFRDDIGYRAIGRK